MLREKRPLLLLVPVLVLAALLRLVWLGQREMWYDEAFSVLYAEKGFSAILYGTISQVENAAADVHPPLYYFLLHIWMTLGQGAFTVRLLSVILGVATVAVSFYLGEELFGKKAGLAGAAVVAISPFHIYYSQEARMYSLLAFLLVLGMYCFVRAARMSRSAYWLGFAICFALALYTHNVAIFWLMALDTYALLLYFRRVNILRQTILANIGVVVLYAPWLLVLPAQLSKVEQAYWIPVPGLVELIRLLITITLNLPGPPSLLPLWVFFSFVLPAVLLRFTVGRFRKEKDIRAPLAFLVVVACFPVVVTFLASQIQPVFIERAFIASALAYYLLIGWAISKARFSPRALLVAVPALAIVALSLSYHYAYDRFPRSPYREAVSYLRANHGADSVIIHSSKLSFFPSHLRDRTLAQHFLPDERRSAQDTLALPTMQVLRLFPGELGQLTEKTEKVYFVVFEKALEESLRAAQPLRDLTWLQARFDTVEIVSFNDLNVYVLSRRGDSDVAASPVRSL